MKVILGIAIVVFTSYCGRFFAKKHRIRKRFYNEFFEFNERYLNEISYYKRPITEFMAKYPANGEFKRLLTDFYDSLREKSTPFAVFSKALEEYDFLRTDEKSFILDYFSMLGKGDSFSQKEYFSGNKKRLLDLKEESEKQSNRYGDLYFKLGFLVGLAVLIIIV